MPEAVLYYFDGRGKGELIRMLLCLIKQKFREEILTERSQLLELIEGGKLQFNQLPLLEINGMKLVQSGAIARYLGKLGGMIGESDKQMAKNKRLLDVFLIMGFKPEEEVKEQIQKQGFPRYLPVFNKLLEGSGTGFLSGPFLSLADVGLFETLQLTVEYFGEEELKDYPKLLEFYKKIVTGPYMPTYFSTYKKRKNDQVYCDTVAKVLGRRS